MTALEQVNLRRSMLRVTIAFVLDNKETVYLRRRCLKRTKRLFV
jgi:hypothetical protein